VYYEADNRQKRLAYTGSGTTYTVNAVYSALQDQFDELNQMDDGTVMSAQTPTEYTIGIIDAGDDDPWFIDDTSAEFLTGGALKSASWKRDLPGDGTGNTGIIRMDYTETTPLIASDIGKTIVMTTDGDTGTILDYNDQTTPKQLWIRPADNTLANDFNDAPTANGAFTITGGTGAGTQLNGAAGSGESLWANVYSIGTIAANTHLYVIQNAAKLTAYKGTDDWWGDGQIDVLIKVKSEDTEIDEAVIQVFGRQFSKTYTHFEVDLTTGGRNPIPLAAGADLNNKTGYRQITATGSSGTGTFDVGDVIGDTDSLATATKLGVVTKVAGTGGTPILDYYLIGDLTDWTGSAADVYDITGDGYCTDASVASVGPGALTGMSIAHGSDETLDINEDGTTENYSIVIDCSDETVADIYEWTKFITMRGKTDTDSDTDGIDGEQYIGSDYKVVYTSITGTVGEGVVVTGKTSGAVGTVVSENATDKIVILRSSRGTFVNGENIYLTDGVHEYVNCTVSVITPINAAPFGTFAGGTFFCAPGVALINVPTADANKFQLTDDDGNVVTAPTKVTITIGNTRALDRIAVFRLDAAGGIIKKDTYTGTVQSAGATTLVVAESIAVDEPTKTNAGVVRLVGDDENLEYRLPYSSWTGSTFTLASTTGLTMDGTGCTTTHIQDTGAFATAKVGDLIRNTTAGAIGYITSIDDNDNANTTVIAGQTNSDAYEINTLPIATTAADTVYVPFIDIHETTGTAGTPGNETAQLTYSADIPVKVVARQAGDIVPYATEATIDSSGLTNNVIRTADTIFV